MRRIINSKTAVRIIVLFFMLIMVASIWPLRLWKAGASFSGGGELVKTDAYVNFENTIQQEFIAQYNRLGSVDLYVSEVEGGRYVQVAILDENAVELFKVYVDTDNAFFPGYIKVPVEYNMEVGKKYFLVVKSCRSRFDVGFEDVPPTSQYVGTLYYNWGPVDGMHLCANYNYTIPMGKAKSLAIMAIIIAVAAMILIASDLYFKRFPEKNRILTVGQTVRYFANPCITAILLGLMIMVFPLRIFDKRPLDIIFYEIGLLAAGFIAYYAVNHKVVRHQYGVSFWQSVPNKNRVIYILMMCSIAMVLWHACNYMNDLYDIYHTLSARRMMIWLLILMLLTFSFKELVNIYNVLWVIASVITGINYYRVNALADTEKEYDLHNAVTKYGIIIAVLSGIMVINLIRLIVNRFKTKKSSVKLTPFGILLLVFLVMIIVMRNTRWWGATLAVSYIMLYIRVLAWENRKDWYKILSGGLMVNFVISLIYSLLHRYFTAYVSGRFGFLFHTVTVTAEYFTFMGAAATVLLVIKIIAFPKKLSLAEFFKTAWKEMALFGFIMSYAIFTVSRTAYLSIIVCVLAVIIVVMAGHKGQFFRTLGIMVLSLIVCFPAAFTLQRIVPAVVAEPVFYAIDDGDTLVRGGANPGSSNFMCVERFANLFAAKILGAEIGDYFYPDDAYNYDSNHDAIYDNYGYPIEESNEEYYYQEGKAEIPACNLLVANGFTRAESFMLLEALNGYVDEGNALDVISNGRITIFRSYLKELNMTGHDTMGAELPNGEIALHAHNTYLQIAYDHGIFVGLLFVILIISALICGIRQYYREEKTAPLTLLTFAITIGFAVAGTSEWVFHFCNPMTVALCLTFTGIIFKETDGQNS